MIKRVILSAVAIFTVMGLTAQEPHGPPPKKEHKSPEERAEHMTDRMTKHLGLTDGQKEKIYEVNLKAAQDMEALRKEAKGAKESLKEKGKGIRENQDSQINEILNEEQRTKWEEGKQKRKEKMRERRGKPGERPIPPHPEED